MATRVFLITPGNALENVVEGVGAAIQSSFAISLTVDLSTTFLNEAASTRQILRSEVYTAIRTLEEYLERVNWPPA
jgi:hypothetical protein